MIIVVFKEIKNNFNYIKENDFLIKISLIASSYALIMHQLMTINGMFVFFIIPILIGFSHIYYLKHFKNNKYILFLLIFLSLGSTFNYGYKYIHKRNFMDLNKADLSKAIDAKVIDSKLSGLKWISCIRPNDPQKEVSEIIKAINIIKADKQKKSIITDYQFISVAILQYDYSPSHVWFINHVAHENNESIYFKKYKKLFLKNILKNDIKVAYLVKPLWQNNNVFEKALNKDCYKKINITEILDKYIFKNCNELNNK